MTMPDATRCDECGSLIRDWHFSYCSRYTGRPSDSVKPMGDLLREGLETAQGFEDQMERVKNILATPLMDSAHAVNHPIHREHPREKKVDFPWSYSPSALAGVMGQSMIRAAIEQGLERATSHLYRYVELDGENVNVGFRHEWDEYTDDELRAMWDFYAMVAGRYGHILTPRIHAKGALYWTSRFVQAFDEEPAKIGLASDPMYRDTKPPPLFPPKRPWSDRTGYVRDRLTEHHTGRERFETIVIQSDFAQKRSKERDEMTVSIVASFKRKFAAPGYQFDPPAIDRFVTLTEWGYEVGWTPATHRSTPIHGDKYGANVSDK